MDEPVTQEWLTIHDAADRAKLHYKTVWKAVSDHELTAYQQGRRGAWRIRIEDLDAWLMNASH